MSNTATKLKEAIQKVLDDNPSSIYQKMSNPSIELANKILGELSENYFIVRSELSREYIRKLIDDNIIGFGHIIPGGKGGQVAGIPKRIVRLWYPKSFPEDKQPDDHAEIVIEVSSERSQYDNREKAIELMRLALQNKYIDHG